MAYGLGVGMMKKGIEKNRIVKEPTNEVSKTFKRRAREGGAHNGKKKGRRTKDPEPENRKKG